MLLLLTQSQERMLSKLKGHSGPCTVQDSLPDRRQLCLRLQTRPLQYENGKIPTRSLRFWKDMAAGCEVSQSVVLAIGYSPAHRTALRDFGI